MDLVSMKVEDSVYFVDDEDIVGNLLLVSVSKSVENSDELRLLDCVS